MFVSRKEGVIKNGVSHVVVYMNKFMFCCNCMFQSGCRKFCHTYRHMTEAEKQAVLFHIAENYGVNQELIVDIVKNFLDSKVRLLYLNVCNKHL